MWRLLKLLELLSKNDNFDNAVKLIREVAKAGVDMVKLQIYIAD